jgi:AhpD family alkylhydroperoxidase
LARIKYADLNQPEIAEITRQIINDRGSVLHLYAMLLHSPPVARGWLSFLTAIRQQSVLAGTIRELVIIQVAILNGAQYEADQHVPIALREGVSQTQIDELQNYRLSTVFDERTKSALAYCEAMTVKVHVDEETFGAVDRNYDQREIVELTATIAAYNLVSRFIEAIEIKSDDIIGDT